MLRRRRLGCCTSRDRRTTSIDFDDHEKVMTYNGLESCITNISSYDNESGISRGGDACGTDSYDDDDASSCCSSNNPSASFSSHWAAKRDEQGSDEWDEEFSASPRHFYVKEKPAYGTQLTDLETMKEKFSKLLLGEDITGGSRGVSTALAISNAITNLSASVFGELWKLEPLPEERKKKWEREIDWLISPTNYMIELVPSKQNGCNGSILEIMTPKARADIHMNLPALQKLDSMLLETLDSMVDNEFWYAEVGSRAEGRSRSVGGQSKRWWLPSPHVPASGLSDNERTKLLNKSKLVNQVFKAAKAINDSILLEMSVPEMIKDALPKSGKECLGEELYKMLTAEATKVKAKDVIDLLNLQCDRGALETINKLEAAILYWKQRIAEPSNIGKSPVRTSWSFMKDSVSEIDKMDLLLNRAEILLQQLKIRYPNLPQTFLDVIKIQYGKDIGHSILEAYSRVLGNLAFCILSRLGDILQEDILSNPNSPAATTQVHALRIPGISDSPTVRTRLRNSLMDQMNKVDGSSIRSQISCTSDMEGNYSDARLSSVAATSSHSRVWCIGRDTCTSLSAESSP